MWSCAYKTPSQKMRGCNLYYEYEYVSQVYLLEEPPEM